MIDEDKTTGIETSGLKPSGLAGWMYWGVLAIFHIAMAGLLAVASVFAMFGGAGLESLAEAVVFGQYQPDWRGVAGLLGLNVSGWLLIWVAIRHLWEQWASGDPQLVRSAGRGAVMVETLIVLVPFMLLTSGISQLVMNQSAKIMAHYAAYQGARTHWVWHDEPDSRRGTSGDVSPNGEQATQDRIEKRSRLAVALVMAPSAPADFNVSAAGDELSENMRAIMKASYMDGTQSASAMSVGGSSGGVSGESENLSFARALGGRPFPERASRKLAFSYAALGEGSNFSLISDGGVDGDVGVEFSYPLQQTFPWFAWLHSDSSGCGETVAGRSGCYIPLNREAEYQQQIEIYD